MDFEAAVYMYICVENQLLCKCFDVKWLYTIRVRGLGLDIFGSSSINVHIC